MGSLDIVPVADGVARVPAPEVLFNPRGTEQALLDHAQFLQPDGTLEFALGGFLIRTGERIVLVDAGLGPINRPPFVGGQMLDEMAAIGVTPGDVTDVVFTHLHFDHVGWATQKGNVTFANATHRCHRADWDHFVHGSDPGAAKKLAPLTDRMEFWEADTVLAPGVSVVGAPGHTPGSTIVVVSDGGEQAMLLGDVVHCPIELVEDDWEALFDVDPATALATRVALARELEGTNTQVAAAHFPGLRFGRLLPGSAKRTWLYS